MQWTLNELENWEELREFVDTALLPLYLYRKDFAIPDHVRRMQYLMALASLIEQKLKGRVLLFPLAYQGGEDWMESALPESFPFTFVLRFSGDNWLLKTESSTEIVHYLTVGDEDLDSQVRFEITADVCYQQILKIWRESVAKANKSESEQKQ